MLKSKSGKPREIPVASSLRAALNGLGPQRSGKVFGVPEITLRRYFPKLLKEAGIGDFRFHDLRHTFASRLVMSGVDLYTVQRLLGHSSIKMTERYAHLAPDYLRAAIQRLEPGYVPVMSLPLFEPSLESGKSDLKI